jgi:hypothetical protein
MFGDYNYFHCPIALYGKSVTPPTMCYLPSLNHGLPNNMK